MESTNFVEEDAVRHAIVENSKVLKEKEKEKINFIALKKQQIQIRRSSK